MNHEVVLRVVLALLTVILYVNHLAHRKVFPKTKIIGGLGEVVMIAAACLWALSLLLYPFGFEWFDFSLPLPERVRWIGVGSMVLCLPLSDWVYRTLGAHFSIKLELLESHRLVINGPYRFVRHPMYSTLFLCVLSTGIVSSNVIVMTTGAVLVVAMSLRIKKEDAMLRRRFGERHRHYVQQTGALIPKLW